MIEKFVNFWCYFIAVHFRKLSHPAPVCVPHTITSQLIYGLQVIYFFTGLIMAYMHASHRNVRGLKPGRLAALLPDRLGAVQCMIGSHAQLWDTSCTYIMHLSQFCLKYHLGTSLMSLPGIWYLGRKWRNISIRAALSWQLGLHHVGLAHRLAGNPLYISPHYISQALPVLRIGERTSRKGGMRYRDTIKILEAHIGQVR